MASAFGHAAAALALGHTGLIRTPVTSILLAGIALSVLPDADSVGFALGLPYGSFWGHRGFSHSIVFALGASFFTTFLFVKRAVPFSQPWYGLFAFFFLSCLSHAVLDALTTGGLGVAFFAPFDNRRYFFPFRPIRVSPISVKLFFEGHGVAVLQSEALWIGVPAVLIIMVNLLVKKARS